MRFTRSTAFLPIAALTVGALLLAGCSPATDESAEHPSTASPAEAEITQVVTFGDSWSDAGTFGGLVFGTSEGGAWPQLLAEMYGDTQEPNRVIGDDGTVEEQGGLNYAEGGAYVAPLSDSDPDTPKAMTAQRDAFLEQHESFQSDQLVTVWAGGNDILTYLGSKDPERQQRFIDGTPTPAELEQATNDVIDVADREAEFVSSLIEAGAERIVVVNMIDLGVTDNAEGIGDGGNAVASSLTATFNLALAEALPDDPRVALYDVAGLVERIEADPGEFGFTIVDADACTDGSYSCGPDAWATPDADRTYPFAGFGHFTAGFRELIAGEVHEFVADTWG
ncbi:MAG TPA: SGNH/GDSL hydrolase family protein [Microbacterium sp.]|nr:SGNH/GDSL hydrolase family protein [Microbacterium sp.]